MGDIEDCRPEIKFDISNHYFASLYPYGKAVELWDMKMPEYEPEYIKGCMFGGFSEKKIDHLLNDWSQWGHLEEDQLLNQDTGDRYTVYRLEDNPETYNLVTSIYKRLRDAHGGDLSGYLENGDGEDINAFTEF